MSLSLVTAPQVEPIRLADAKLQVQQSTNVDDAILEQFIIPAARDRGELATRRAWLTQTWDWFQTGFPDNGMAFEIPKPPLQSVTFVKYTDVSGTVHTLVAGTDYVVETPAGPRCRRGRIALPYGSIWPFARPQLGSVQIRFVCGYGDSDSDVPPLLRQANLLDIGTLYADRENVITGTIVAELPGGIVDIYRSFRSMPTRRLRSED